MRQPLIWMIPLLSAPMAGHAELGAKPLFPKNISQAEPTAPTRILGKAQLIAGKPLLLDRGQAYPLSHDQALGPGQAIQVPPGARVRVRLPNGDALHLGEGSLAALQDKPSGWSVQMWEGAVTIYAAPGRTGLGQVETPHGILEAGEGKLGLVLPGDTGATAYAFNNWRSWETKQKEGAFRLNAAGQDWQVQAFWKSEDGQAVSIPAGQMLRQDATGRRVSSFNPDIEVDLTFLTSPEAEAVGEAVLAFENGRMDQAATRFEQTQKAFPSNAMAAYYLGVIAMERGQHFETIRQWQTYIQIDPEGAAAKGIPEKVTLLVDQELRAEVDRALKQESALNQQPPEPGTVAVMPFVNRGDAAQAILSKGLAAMMISDLSKVPGIKVLERAKLQMLTDEIALYGSGLVDEKSAVRAGKLMRAEKLLIGDFKVQIDGN